MVSEIQDNPPLQVVGASMSFGGVKVLTDVDITIDGDGIVALVGPNGAGKTTLFNVICGALKPSRGEVSSFGETLSGLSAEAIAGHGVYRTFQDLRLFRSLSVRENVCVGLGRTLRKRSTIEKVDALLEELDLAQFEKVRARDLAHGAAKLLTVARVLIHDPKVLLLDEPGAGMDIQSYERLAAALKRRTDLPLVLVEHNLDTVRDLASRVVFLDGGRVIADGPTEEILSRDDLAAVYFGSGGGSGVATDVAKDRE
ncbi:MAG TPA: ATP-binding cassette domain-containing protein [Acidimicrobiales bacterium]